jgi:4a-hydroxytetrahydrobiopterin dehydratase
MGKATVLSKHQLAEALARVAGWRLERGELVRDFEFSDFAAAMAFVNQVAILAEAADHHPDIDVRYSKVRLGLVTHSAGGSTENDISLAEAVSPLF